MWGVGVMRRITSCIVVILMVTAGLLFVGSSPQASAQPSDLTAGEAALNNGAAGAGVDSVAATTTLTGYRSWIFFLGNYSQGPVTPTVSVDSGYDPSLFCSSNPPTCDPLSSFPRTNTGPSLLTGQEWHVPDLLSSVSTTFTPGFDSARAMNPLVIPAGGAEQTVTVTLRAADPNIENLYVFPYSPVPGASIVTVNGPANLNQGESFTWESLPPGGQASIRNIQTGKTYVLTIVLDVPNPFGAAFTHRPETDVAGELRGTTTCQGCLGTSVTIPDPTLDGPATGRGGATFSVAEPGHSWDAARGTQYRVDYQSEASPVPAFSFAGFFPPVDNPPTINTAKAGSGIPVKFSLGGNQGLNILASGSPSSRQITCNTGAPLDPIQTTVTAGGSSLSYNPTTGQYVYVWKTQQAWAGTCRQLDVQLSDGSHHVADFEFH
jgi:hypothetical protein